jgi:hypothetical protein
LAAAPFGPATFSWSTSTLASRASRRPCAIHTRPISRPKLRPTRSRSQGTCCLRAGSPFAIHRVPGNRPL